MPVQTESQYLINRDIFSNYYLDNLLPETDRWQDIDEGEIAEIYEEIKEIYDEHLEYVETYKEDFLEDKFIRPIFKILGLAYGTQESVERRQRVPDYGIFEDEESLKKAYKNKEDEDFYKNAITIAEAKRWDRNLDKRGDVRDFTNPSHQVYVYLQETPVNWAILTNGREWRLYYSKTSHKLDSYYQIDLPTLIESDREDKFEIFKYFYLFFRKEAFVEDKRGNSFLDKIYDKSHIFSQELGENLKENIYEAIKLMAEGFLKFPQNDLDPVEDIDIIHDSSLVYLYRMIFVLYAESEGRDLLDTKNRIYNQEYSLNTLKQEVCEELEKSDPKYREWQHDLWDDLEELFLLIDKGSKNMGIPEDDLYIPAYNGGLFRTEIDDDANEENVFLQENKVGDSYLAEVIDLLTRHESDNGKGRVFVDYSSLDIRHLGSIYEGLLEYHLNVTLEPMVAVKDGKEQRWVTEGKYDEDDGKIVEKLDEGDVYLTTDKGERKATGSYYTPEYVVQYIVENTLDPILKEIKEELLKEAGGNFADQFAERVFELKILDPAMGSGHFLTNAVDHLAKEIVNAHEKQAEEFGAETVDESHDIHWARRQVVQRCIYGVDLNPMAVELAKVSLWLRTLASQQPLAFLDHHLKTGNSLIGSDIEEIEELSSGSAKKEENLASLEDFGMTKKGTMEDLMKIYQDFIKIENQELKDIKEIEKKYHDFEHEPIRERLEAMANVHTAREFGVDIPKDAFEKMAKGIDGESSWDKIEGEEWFKEAQELAGEKNFFHWKLAYPETFYEEDGGKKANPGFDAVIGNPPYRTKALGHGQIESSKDLLNYLRKKYPEASEYKSNLFTMFFDLSNNLRMKKGYSSMIIPATLLTNHYFKKFRNKILNKYSIVDIVDTKTRVFGEVVTGGTTIFTTSGKYIKKTKITIMDDKRDYFVKEKIDQFKFKEIDDQKFILSKEKVNLLINLKSKSTPLNNRVEFYQGIITGNNTKFLSDEKKSEMYKKVLRGRDIHRHYISWGGKYVLFDKDNLWSNTNEKMFEEIPKIIIRQTSDKIIAGVDKNGYFSLDSTHLILSDSLDMYSLSALLNSKLLNAYYQIIVPERGRAYSQVKTVNVGKLPLKYGKEIWKKLRNYENNISRIISNKNKINIDIEDYLSNYTEGEIIGNLYLPFKEISNTIITDTSKERENLRIGHINFEQEDDTLILKASARYKPENPEEHETDRWGYTETDLIPAMKFTGSEMELALIREFTKLAVDKAGGFANFREKATKTMSILDRLEKLTLPKLSDVGDGLEKYLKQKEKAERLEEEIKETDHTIDAIVFDLYELDEEEVETVLDSLDTPEDEKEDILEKFRDVRKN